MVSVKKKFFAWENGGGIASMREKDACVRDMECTIIGDFANNYLGGILWVQNYVLMPSCFERGRMFYYLWNYYIVPLI